MKILVTGSNGFVGKNLVTALERLKESKELSIEDVYKIDLDNYKELDKYTKDCDIVFHFAGVNRPQNNDFKGNYFITEKLLLSLAASNNTCPIIFSSSIQATLEGRFKDSEYGKSKLEAENLLKEYSKKCNVPLSIYRFPNLFGKWCKPNYNSVIATFCYNIANNLECEVNEDNEIIDFYYIDDLVSEMIKSLSLKEREFYPTVSPVYKKTVKEIYNTLISFKEQEITLKLPKLIENSFEKKLFSTYISYLSKDKVSISLKSNKDDRGSFTEIFKTLDNGQFSINVIKPGNTKGQHYHDSKLEIFVVVKGEALIKERNIVTNELIEYKVNDDDMKMVYMLPGYTHSITNTSNTEDTVVLIWANETFNKDKPDTYSFML